jgi:integrase/recombinase XerD
MLRPKKKTSVRERPLDPSATNPLRAYQAAFVEWTEAMGFAKQTATIRKVALDYFIRWCDERGLQRPQDITKPILERYQRHLYHYRKADGQPLAFSSQATRLNPLKAFFKWLARENHLLYNPASELTLPKLPRRLPQTVLSVEAVETVLNQPDVETLAGLRDRTMLEMLYSTAIRRMELASLKVFDVNTRHGTVMVKQGKGARDRMVPIGRRALAWLDKYLAEARPELVAAHDDGTLFLTDYGEAFEKNRLGDQVKRHLRAAGITAPGSCHLFRHACATHMLENGADIRYIQAMLGHSELSTTQIYTQVSIVKLREIHAATHPARLTRAGSDAIAEAGDEGRIDAMDEKQTLLAALAAETEDDETA